LSILKEISQPSNHQYICPEFLKPLKAHILHQKEALQTLWAQYWKARPGIFSESKWISWSTPREIVDQIWEWDPLQNFRLLVEIINPSLPTPSLQLLLILSLITLTIFLTSYYKFKFLIKSNNHRDTELETLKSITRPKRTKNLYPSPNYKQECKAKWFRLIPWVYLLPALDNI